MSLKRQYQVSAAFSMASMTDVIFLLLIFFMVTSTFVLPAAMEVNLPESSEETPLRPSARVYVDAAGEMYVTFDTEEPRAIGQEELMTFMQLASEQELGSYVAVYADENITYGRLVQVLDMGAANGVRMVLATKPAPESVKPETKTQQPSAAATSTPTVK